MPDEVNTPPAREGRLKRRLLLVVVPAIVLLVAGVVYLRGGRYVETENAYVKADKVPVAADVAGIVSDVLVQENEVVAAGQALLRIDQASFQVAVSKADAKLAQVRTDVGMAAIEQGSFAHAQVVVVGGAFMQGRVGFRACLQQGKNADVLQQAGQHQLLDPAHAAAHAQKA